MNEINNQLIQAIDTIITSRLNDLAFDNTIVCEILKVGEDKTEYIVSTGTSEFTAYGNKEYFVGQKVYVTIPQNNYSLKKIIVGNYSAETTTPFEYTNPFERLVDITGNLVAIGSQNLMVIANKNGQGTISNEKIELSKIADIISPPESFGQFKYMGLRVTFKTTMENVIQGRYGLRLHLIDTNNQQHEFVFDSTELYGNPYYYDEPGFTHEKLFAYPDNITFKEGYIELYQLGNFSTTATNEEINNPNIYASDIYFTIGIDQQDFVESVFDISTDSSLKYTEDTNTNMKTIQASLINFNSESKNYESPNLHASSVGWYRYRVGNANVGGGNHWEKLFKATIEGKDWLQIAENNKKSKIQQAIEINESISTFGEENKLLEPQELIAEELTKFNGYIIKRSENNLELNSVADVFQTLFYSLDLSNSEYIKNEEFLNIKLIGEPLAPNKISYYIACGNINNDSIEVGKMIFSDEAMVKEYFVSDNVLKIRLSDIKDLSNFYFIVNRYTDENYTFALSKNSNLPLELALQEYNEGFETYYYIKDGKVINEVGVEFPSIKSIATAIEQPIGSLFTSQELIGKNAEGQYRITSFPYLGYQTEKVKAILTLEEKQMTSSILEFEYQGTAIENDLSADVNKQIIINKSDSGYYPFYDENYKLVGTHGYKTLGLSFADGISSWDEVKQIKWKVPNNFPIKVTTSKDGANLQDESFEGSYKIYISENTQQLTYRLEDKITNSNITGYIYCYVIDIDGNESSDKVFMSFGPYGSSGTDFSIVLTDTQGNIAQNYLIYNKALEKQETKFLEAHILDLKTNTYIDLTDDEKSNFIWEWVYDFNKEFYAKDLDGDFNDPIGAWEENEKQEYATQIASNLNEKSSIKSFSCQSIGEYNVAILKITYQGFALANETSVDLVTYFPWSVIVVDASEDTMVELEPLLGEGILGKTEIVYDVTGKMISTTLDKTPYGFANDKITFIYGTFLTENNSSSVPQIKGVEDENTLVYFKKDSKENDAKILSSLLLGENIDDKDGVNNIVNNFYNNPYLFDYNQDTKIDDQDVLILQSMSEDKKALKSFYLQPVELNISDIDFPWMTIYLQGKYGDIPVIWQQPLLIRKNTYGSQMLNDWSGKQVIDEEGNKILTSLLVAGEKNRFNQFTGVVVGDVQQTHSNTSNELNGYGIYGFKDGTNRFKLDENGNFFVGQGDGSYLKFDDEGFMLNLKSGNFIINANNFSIDASGTVDISKLIAEDATIKRLEAEDADIKNLITDSLSAVNANITSLNSKVADIEKAYITEADVGTLVANNISTSKLRVGQIYFNDGTTIASSTPLSTVFDTKNSYIGSLEGATGRLASGITVGDFADSFYLGKVDDGMVLQYRDADGENGIHLKFNINRAEFSGRLAAKQFESYSSTGSLDLKQLYGYSIYLGSMNGADGDSSITIAGRNTGNKIYIKTNDFTGNTAYAWSSDKNLKHSIRYDLENYETLFNFLKPCYFKFNDGTSNRYHTGFIAQEVEEAIIKAKLTSQDFAGLVIENLQEGGIRYTLRYSEFISLNTWQIQKLKARVTELENKLAQLEQQ